MREEYLNVFQINRVLNTDLDSDYGTTWMLIVVTPGRVTGGFGTDERDVWEYYPV